jgi:xylan 1,4-beta-xylosidase
MPNTSRRSLFKTFLAGAVATPLPLASAATPECASVAKIAHGARGIEGQRKADLGDGTYLNPIVAGDHPDPTILKDGDDYYMTFSSFDAHPGLVIWHSTDLVNWAPLGPALREALGSIWAVDLCKHEGRYFIYMPVLVTGRGFALYASWTDDVRGPWSDPVDLKIDGCIDPGHVVGEDGKRYLFVNGVRKIRLTDDGLAADGELEPAYSPIPRTGWWRRSRRRVRS